MRNWVWIGIALVALIALALGGGLALARQDTAPAVSPETEHQWGIYLDRATLVRVATALGLTPQELTTQLQSGQTLAQVAKAKGVETGKVVEAILAPYRDEIQLRLKYGAIIQAQADLLLATAKLQAEFLLNQTVSAPGIVGTPNFSGDATDMAAACNSMMGGQGGGMMGGQGSGMMGSQGGGMMGSQGSGMMGGQGSGMMGSQGSGMMGSQGSGMMGGWGGAPRFGSGFWGRGMMGGW